MKKTFKFSILALLVAALTALMLMVSASAASLEELSTEIKAGKQYKTEYSVSNESRYYKINVSEGGQLKLNMEINFSEINFYVYDEKGEWVSCLGVESSVGQITKSSQWTSQSLRWNGNVEKGEGVAVFNVSKGTYYILLKSNSSGKLNFTAEFPSNDTPATKSIRLKITLNEGDTLRLGAVIDPEDAEEPKWTSSNKEVATVSKSGKITAVSAGTATIKCKSGGKTLKIKLVVETA